MIIFINIFSISKMIFFNSLIFISVIFSFSSSQAMEKAKKVKEILEEEKAKNEIQDLGSEKYKDILENLPQGSVNEKRAEVLKRLIAQKMNLAKIEDLEVQMGSGGARNDGILLINKIIRNETTETSYSKTLFIAKFSTHDEIAEAKRLQQVKSILVPHLNGLAKKYPNQKGVLISLDEGYYKSP